MSLIFIVNRSSAVSCALQIGWLSFSVFLNDKMRTFCRWMTDETMSNSDSWSWMIKVVWEIIERRRPGHVCVSTQAKARIAGHNAPGWGVGYPYRAMRYRAWPLLNLPTMQNVYVQLTNSLIGPLFCSAPVQKRSVRMYTDLPVQC